MTLDAELTWLAGEKGLVLRGMSLVTRGAIICGLMREGCSEGTLDFGVTGLAQVPFRAHKQRRMIGCVGIVTEKAPTVYGRRVDAPRGPVARVLMAVEAQVGCRGRRFDGGAIVADGAIQLGMNRETQ